MMNKILLAVLCFFCLPIAHAGNAIGQVLVASEGVYATGNSGEKRNLGRGAAIFEQDTILTGPGKAQIRFIDGALFTLKPETEFKVKQYAFKPKQKASLMEVLKGGFRTMTGLIMTGLIAKAAPENYRVDTPVATLGVRGTVFRADITGNSLSVGWEFGSDTLINPENPKPFVVNDLNPYAVADSTGVRWVPFAEVAQVYEDAYAYTGLMTTCPCE